MWPSQVLSCARLDQAGHTENHSQQKEPFTGNGSQAPADINSHVGPKWALVWSIYNPTSWILMRGEAGPLLLRLQPAPPFQPTLLLCLPPWVSWFGDLKGREAQQLCVRIPQAVPRRKARKQEPAPLHREQEGGAALIS